MTNLSKEDLASLIASVVTQVMQGQTATPKASSKPTFLPKGSHAAPSDLAAKDAALAAAFLRRGFKVTLKNRDNPDAPYDVKPFKAWLDEGRIVRKGQRGVKGLFHVTQTDALPGKASAKPAITSEQKALFAKAKAALKAKAKPQPASA
jgi:hypothetical protein